MIGQPAPDFTLPAVHREGDVSLADYRGKPLFLAIFAGLYCPFCRRNIAQLGGTQQKLHDIGVETLGVVLGMAGCGRSARSAGGRPRPACPASTIAKACAPVNHQSPP